MVNVLLAIELPLGTLARPNRRAFFKVSREPAPIFPMQKMRLKIEQNIGFSATVSARALNLDRLFHHRVRVRLLRVATGRGRQAALFHQRCGWRGAVDLGPLG